MIERYRDPDLALVWSRARQIHLWVEIETAWVYQLDETAWIDARNARVPTPAEVAERERSVRHEFVAFLEVWSERLSSDAGQRWVHWGLTSSDVIDTATAIQLKDTHAYLRALADGLQEALCEVSDNLGNLTQVGRTHGQWAQPRLARTPIRALLLMLNRQVRRMAEAGADLIEGDFSGATGGRDMLDASKVTAAMGQLGLSRALASTQILPRDAWVHWAHAVAGLVTVCEAIATHYWQLAQSEVAEVEVHRGAGSSAMPHKRGNPHIAENVVGMARMARGYASTLDGSIVQRGDRDLAHSSVERVALPDLAHVAALALQRTTQICQDYQYAPENIEANLTSALNDRADSAIFAMTKVAEGMSRRDAITETRNEQEQSA